MSTVNLRHPGYQDDNNVLLTLQGHPEEGLDAETARIACCILAGNRWDGQLSLSKNAHKLKKSVAGRLKESDYYFHLPNGEPGSGQHLDCRSNKRGPYPITARFADWTFPKDDLPGLWKLALEGQKRTSQGQSLSAEASPSANSCVLCGEEEGALPNWLWDSDERRVFDREGDKLSIINVLRTEESDNDEDDGTNSDAEDYHDPLEHSLSQIRLCRNCSAANDSDTWWAFSLSELLFVPKKAGRDFVLAAELFAPTENLDDLRLIYGKSLPTSLAISVELHFVHFVQAVFSQAEDFWTVDIGRAARVLDAKNRLVLLDADTRLCQELVISDSQQIWPDDKDSTDSDSESSEDDDSEDDEDNEASKDGETADEEEGTREDAVDETGEKSTEDEAVPESSTKDQLAEVNLTTEELEEAFAELQNIVNDAESSEDDTEPVFKTIWPGQTCVDCGEAIFDVLYRSMKSEERAVCSDCIDDHLSDDEVFIPVYYSAWKQRIPSGDTGLTSNSSDSSGETSSNDADGDHILTADEIASFLALHSSSTQSLVYEQSLQDDVDPKIRILWVEPAAFDEPIQCHLETVTLATAPYFEALSYCWGPTEPEAYIHVNDCKIRVTPNLKLALRRLRRSNAARPFWIDAICINQSDTPEKSNQVQRMRDIYVKADSTTVWLGEEEDNSRLALDMCTRIFAAHGAYHMRESYLIDVKKEYQDWRTKQDLGVSENPEDEDFAIFAEQFDLESLSLHAGYKLGYDAAFEETRRDLTLKSMADSIKEEEAKFGPTGIDQSDPQRYSELLGQMMAQNKAQGLEWKGPFQQLYREIMEEDESTTEDAAAPTEQTASESVEETQAHVEPAVGESKEKGATTVVARSPYAKAVQLILTSTAVPDETEPPTSDEATALHKFFDRPWFRRIWIVQEAGVSRNITVQCGAQEIDWWIFAFGYEIASRLKRSIRIGPKYHRNFTTMSALRSSLLLKNIQWESDLDPDIANKGVDVDDLALLSLLTKYRGYLATDPRDKVFALLGLTNSDLNELNIRPDYAVPMRDVYIDVARALMEKADHLDLFAIPCNRTNPSSTLPSWVPDWADVQSQPYLLTDKRESQDPNDTLEGFREFTASQDTKSHVVIEEGGILHLSGYAVDSIAEIGGMMDVTDDALTFTTQDMGEDGTNKAYWGMLNAILEGVSKDADVVNDWAKLARTSDTRYKYPGTGEDAFTAFARTLYTDTDKKTYLTDCKDWVDQFAILGPILKQIPRFDLDNLTVESIVDAGSKIKPFMSILNSPAMQNVGKRSCVHTLYRRLARTQNGLLALVPANTMLNDHIALLQGGKTPYIVRQRQESGYILVGETFVHGLMYGEGWEAEKCHTITFH